MICYILDDQYGKIIYTWLSALHQDWQFPIQDNIVNPMTYLDDILEKEPDYILLDNYFPNRTSWREEALWEEFLETYLDRSSKTQIICISDYGTRLLDHYEMRSKWYQTGKVVAFIPSKHPKDIDAVIDSIL